MAKVKCSYCNKEISKKPSQIAKSKHNRFYCNTKCKSLDMKQLKREEVEKRIGQDLEEYLMQKYVVEKKPTTWIMEDAKIHSHYIVNCFKDFGIVARNESERFQNWWDSTGQERKKEYIKEISIRAKKNLTTEQSRNKLRVTMGSKEYREKISKANTGIDNGMYDSTLSKSHRTKTRALFGYKKWAIKVKERDNFTCQKCLKKGNAKSLHAHHINDYYEYEKGRLDLDNAITLCSSCHSIFHNRNKGISASKELLDKFMQE